MRKLLTLVLFTLLPALVWAANPKVELTTNLGKIELELYPEKPPSRWKTFCAMSTMANTLARCFTG